MRITRKQLGVIFLLLVFIGVSVGMSLIPSADIVRYVGSDNALFLMFSLGAIGGLTTFSGLPYQVILMSFAAGGINPIALGVVTALGVMIGDSTMFLVSKRASNILPSGLAHYLERVAQWLKRHPRLLTPILVTYGTISPFSNDFMVASLSLVGYSYRKVIIPLAIGNIFFNIGLAYIGLYAYDNIMNWW